MHSQKCVWLLLIINESCDSCPNDTTAVKPNKLISNQCMGGPGFSYMCMSLVGVRYISCAKCASNLMQIQT